MAKTTLGSKIKDLRKSKGYTLETLGRLTESSKSYIHEVENGTLLKPSAEKVSLIAKKLDVTIEYLIDGVETLENSIDAEFYRKYKLLDNKTKAKVRGIMDLLYIV